MKRQGKVRVKKNWVVKSAEYQEIPFWIIIVSKRTALKIAILKDKKRRKK